MKFFYLLFLSPFIISCGSEEESTTESIVEVDDQADSSEVEEPLYCNEDVTVGAARFAEYLPLLEGKKVGLVGNQSSQVGTAHLVDTLIAQGVDMVKVFSPEHGFRGDADAGEVVKDGVDPKSGLPVISLYGSNKKPKSEQLKDLDVLLFDIQDVGARFYTYISTLHYVLEAAAENGKSVIVLDRPNPNGHYVDGPILKEGFSSFVGKHPVPIVHGMTIGEYGQMLNEEGWLKGGVKADLTVIEMDGWDHTKFYELPIAPSPNLPNMKSVYWYPSLCLFEGTVVSIGRGTDIPFQCVGHPKYEVDILEALDTVMHFTPAPNHGASKPKLNGEECYGYDLSVYSEKQIRNRAELDLSYLFLFYETLEMKKDFFLSNGMINLLYGSDELKNQMLKGVTEEQLRESWQEDLKIFKDMRGKYLLYKDF